MTDEERIEDSLRICEELRRYQKESPLQKEPPSQEGFSLRKEPPSQEGFSLRKESPSQEESHPRKSSSGEPETDSQPTTGSQPNTFSSEVIRKISGLILCMLIAVLISYGIIRYVAHQTKVEGISMETTLKNNDHIIVEEVSYYFHEPRRYDIIVFPFTDNRQYIKRIIGLPNETIQIREGKVYINGAELNETYGNEIIEKPGLAEEEIKLGKDEYFVLGDNRNSSVDSRSEEVGTVKRDEIIGRACFRFFPFGDMVTL